MVRWSCCIPFIPKYSHWSGMITSVATTRALTQSRPSEGGQSMTAKSNSGSRGASFSWSTDSRPNSVTSWSSAPESSMLAGRKSRPIGSERSRASAAVVDGSVRML